MSAEDMAERFARDTADHEMTVLHDDGLYRHVRFQAASHGFYWFDLITVPHALIFRGDGESFVFSRTEDMFGFFRDSARWSSDGMNLHYWQEKLTSRRDAAWAYSQGLFNEQVAAGLAEAEKDYPGVTAAWGEKVSGFLAEYNTEYEDGAREALSDFEYLPENAGGEPFRFSDTWEWQLRDYHWWFVWACHAIVWGIGQYDKARTAEAVA